MDGIRFANCQIDYIPIPAAGRQRGGAYPPIEYEENCGRCRRSKLGNRESCAAVEWCWADNDTLTRAKLKTWEHLRYDNMRRKMRCSYFSMCRSGPPRRLKKKHCSRPVGLSLTQTWMLC